MKQTDKIMKSHGRKTIPNQLRPRGKYDIMGERNVEEIHFKNWDNKSWRACDRFTIKW